MGGREGDGEREIRRGSGRESPAVIWSVYTSRSGAPHVKRVGPALLSQGHEFVFLYAPQFPAEQSVFFHSALGDDSVGLLRFTLSRIRAGSLLIIFHSLSSVVC